MSKPECLVLQTDRLNAREIGPALGTCFKQRGWRVVVEEGGKVDIDKTDADLICGYGWHPWMQAAYKKQPDRLIHVDLAFWARTTHYKLAMGGRWSPLTNHDYPPDRLNQFRVKAQPTRLPGRKILVAGMSAKASADWGYKPEQWELDAINRLWKAGADVVVYRPKPTWQYYTPTLAGAWPDNVQRPVSDTLKEVDGVVSHHSNVAVDALAVGLPIYVDVGIAKSLSVPALEEIVGATAPDIETRTSFLREVAWHQWTIQEMAQGRWLKPPAPLAGHPLLVS